MPRTVIALALVLVATGCGMSRFEHLVQRSGGGIVQLDGAIVPATRAAHLAMMEHCHGRWRTLDAQEARAMQLTTAQGKSQSDAAGAAEAQLGAAVTPIALDDRHIAYACISR